MRKLTEGNKSRFAIFAIIILGIIAVLAIVLTKALSYEKEVYEISKDASIYDVGYEYINLTSDAVIEKKWNGKYYLTELDTNLGYELGNTAIAYDSIKNRLNLYGTFYEVALDGETTKLTKNTEISNMLEPKLYKIEDRKYLIVADEISNETGTLTAENYLIVVIDKSGNTLLLNNDMDIKTINAIVLKTEAFKFDVANEKLIIDDSRIDLKKIIGSSNEYIQTAKREIAVNQVDGEKATEEEEEKTTVANGGVANALSQTFVNVGGGTSINIGNNTGVTNSIVNSNSQRTNSSSSGGTNSSSSSTTPSTNLSGGSINNNNSSSTNSTTIQKSVSLRSATPAETYIDLEYSITDPENEYQVVYVTITGGGETDVISLDKDKNNYRIVGLNPNTDYRLVLGYREIKKNATIEDVIEDTINVKTLKVQGSLVITKVTVNKIYFNLKLDKNSSYDNAKIGVYVNNNKQNDTIKVDIDKALQANGWTSSIDITPQMSGKVTLSLEDVRELKLSSSAQIN